MSRSKIQLLSEAVANQVAAGEVINRPSSVVKELLENAVDAGSSNITVNFRDGGKVLIQVVDDGVGMSPMDARLAFDRHATSKISRVEDIYMLSTFGFRGEALASISSIAEVELRTRQQEDELGTRVEIVGGKFIGQEAVSTPVGSQFAVKNIFYNIPARRRFLEKSTTESRHIVAEFQRVALCNPDIGFSLYDTDALISKLPPATVRQRIVDVIGRNIAKNLLETNADTSIVKVEGFAGRPSSAKQNNREQFLFVNGRYFRSPYLHKAIVAAYEKLIPTNTQPSYFIYLTIDTEKIDVNVHPQKTEVKFSDGSSVWQIINAALRESLAKSGAVPQMDFEIDSSVEIPVIKRESGVVYDAPTIRGNPDFNPFQHSPSEGNRERNTIRFDSGAELAGEPGRGVYQLDRLYDGEYERSLVEFVAGDGYEQGTLQIDGATQNSNILIINSQYFATSINGTVVIIDVRRAYESVLYDRYLTMLTSKSSACQQLLFPETVTMSIDDISLLEQHISDFIAFGFDLKVSDEHTVEISGLPADFILAPVEDLLYDLLDTIREQSVQEGAEIRRKRLATTMSKLGAQFRAQTMGEQELNALLKQLYNSENPSYTPSGSPTMFAIGREEIELRLKQT